METHVHVVVRVRASTRVWGMMAEKAVKTLAPLLSEARMSKIVSVVACRTNTIAVLLENVTDRGNENAIARSMDALGVQNLHSVRGKTVEAQRKKVRFSNRTDSGARNWIMIHSWADVSTCVKYLKTQGGYKIAVAAPDAEISISELDCTQRLVLAFGNENKGVSEELTELSDTAFSLPMCGFVQSYNVSVSAAISLYHAHRQRVEQLVSPRLSALGCVTYQSRITREVFNCCIVFLHIRCRYYVS